MESYFEKRGQKESHKNSSKIWTILFEIFPCVVSNLSQPFWFVGKLIFCVSLLGVQSSCTSSQCVDAPNIVNLGHISSQYVDVMLLRKLLQVTNEQLTYSAYVLLCAACVCELSYLSVFELFL